jgi:ABC-type uncharacterized transport system substrate-binding protein
MPHTRHLLLRRLRFSRPLVAALGALLASVLGTTDRAAAHPHVWIEVKAALHYERGTFTGIRQTWIFDELYSTQAVDGLPAAADGSYGRAELAELAKANMEGLKEFGYFTQISLGGQPLKVGVSSDAYLEHIVKPKLRAAVEPVSTSTVEPQSGESAAAPGFWSRVWDSLTGNAPTKPAVRSAASAAASRGETRVLALTFMLPFEQPILADVPDLEITIADPSIFIWLEPAKADALSLTGDAPKTCVIKFKTQDSEDQQKKLGDAFATSFGGGGVVQMGGPRTITARC